ncbi:stage V sporulation protein B [Paenibacillus flagellatus]|uniref:Stage V sporulation protein B n=1 Tax=Paenibacillus flagellatus TaxID=2211139 RepID=A0A2V5KQ15_9BACL|nr:stage V sporulation protein B [Paenibacillus flagellatus]PYI53317.1 stage V sporulation protein B [Paenibacillus flagellatus]
MRKQSFIKGTMILLAAGIVNRILGFVPRITLPRVIGAEGVGLYQLGYPFMIVIITIISGGIPLAVAKLVAEAESERDERKVRSILRASLAITCGLAFVFTLLCIWAAPWITSRLLTDSRVYYTFLSMCPILPIVAVSAVYRGYFQGRQNMIPTAASQVVETIVRIAAMLGLAYAFLPYGTEWAAAGAMMGVVVGEFGGMAVLLYSYSKGHDRIRLQAEPSADGSASSRFRIRKLFDIAIPVTASRLVGSASYLLESILTAQSLAIAGVATAVATAQYGVLQGMVIPVLLLPGALTYSLSVSLVPSLSEAAARGDMRTIHKRLHQSLRLALVTGAPFAVIMYVLAEPLCYYLYGNAEVGKMLKMMAPVALFLYYQGPLQATLQALDRPGSALTNTFVGAVVKLALIVYLASRPQWGILGAVVAINVNIALVTMLHWHSVSRLLRFRMQAGDYVKTGFAAAVMGACCYAVMNGGWHDMPFVRFASACALGSLVYLLMIVWLKLVDASDVSRLPWIGKRPRS